MTERLKQLRSRQDFLAAEGVLLIVRQPPVPPPPAPGQPPMVPPNAAEGDEILLSVWDDGRAIGMNGHVDLGTGIRTALTQIVAEELDLGLDQVDMILGDTACVPNQGPTIASASIQIHSLPLRQAAAQARGWLLASAAERLGLPQSALVIERGQVQRADGSGPAVRYADLLQGRRVVLSLDTTVAFKPAAAHRIIGRDSARVDIPAKAFGAPSFVHDMRAPGMLHGRVVRPPYAGADHGDFIGNSLESVDEQSIAHIPGIRAVVVIRDFVGVVAEREEHAEQAAAELQVRWKPWGGLPPLQDVAQALKDNPATPRRLIDEGDVDAALDGIDAPMERAYLWPYQMHASIGPSCGLAQWHGPTSAADAAGHVLTVWAGTQNPHVLRADLACLLEVDELAVEVIRMEAAGCYGRNCADDVVADAALLSRAVGAPVRVQLTREQEHLWEPKGAAQLMQVRGGLDREGGIAAWDFSTTYPSNASPTLALLLTRRIEPLARAFEMGDRTARPPYAVDNLRVTVNDMAPILRASWLRGVSALPNSFAHESWVDELATAAGVDPLAYRLRHLPDERARELLQATAARAGWKPHVAPCQQAPDGDWLRGQGLAYARYVHSKWPGFGAAWSAWVADVDVNRVSGEVHVRRVVVGHDAGMMINPAGIRHQVHGNVIQATSRALKEQVRIEPVQNLVAAREWGSYPILSFRDVPVIEVMNMPRPDEPPLGAGESASVPGAAAIANAIFDATGVRFRQPPFTAEVVRAALHPSAGGAAALAGGAAAVSGPRGSPPADAPWQKSRGRWARLTALAAGVAGIALTALGWPRAIAPVMRPDPAIYTAEVLERGRLLAAAGNCITCHTASGGQAYAGGRPMATPFGTVYATNLTPDVATGIGAWSFSAFQRAMREGISRDGHRLYPAFPYTAFTRMPDDDLMALYAWLMSRPAVSAESPRTALAFPFNVRPLLGLWNALFLTPGPTTADLPGRDARWQRGEYLVNGLGHCGACHTDRNLLGGERAGRAFLGGALIKGWEAPPLTAATHAPVPWTEDALYRYLRDGYSALHGAATGPMADVVRELAVLPDEDIAAMAHYLTSFQQPISTAEAEGAAREAIARGQAVAPTLTGSAQRLFEQGCAACHHDGDGPRLLGVNVPLALNSNLHSDRPDNLLRAILDGVRAPPALAVGFMPAFRDAFDDRQLAELAAWMRARFAPQRPPWSELEATVARIRAEPSLP